MDDALVSLVNLLPAKNREELRAWLEKHHDKEQECWVLVRRGRPTDDTTFWYLDAVEEALCFGWIDSVVKKAGGGKTAQRLTPRRRGSAWSELNKERCRRMERLGRMTDAGRAVLPDMSPNGFVIEPDVLAALKEDPEVWRQFQQFPPLYQRVRVNTVQIKRNMLETFRSRLQKRMEITRSGTMYGTWNDYGKLGRVSEFGRKIKSSQII